MAGGGAPSALSRELDQTPTWAVSAICAVIILISILLEKVLHAVGKMFEKKKKKAMLEALEKLKGELMVLGFMSLLLTFGQSYITKICIPDEAANTMLPRPKVGHVEVEPAAVGEQGGEGGGGAEAAAGGGGEEHHRRLLWFERRFLSAESAGPGCKPERIRVVTESSLEQIREWKIWEKETVMDQESLNDPLRFRLTHETSFVRDHSHLGTKNAVVIYLVSFSRQFFRSIRKADYPTMRHGFVTVHLAPGSKFDLQKYIKRYLEDDFKVVVGISPLLWASVTTFLLLNVHGWEAMFWLSILPLIVILSVGTKLQFIISQMALEIQERHAVNQGIPLIQVSDSHFWFSWPQLILYLIQFVLFQNAFEITYFFWIWYEFGLKSCFHENFNLVILRVALRRASVFSRKHMLEKSVNIV